MIALLILTPLLLHAADWHVFGGFESAYNSQYFTGQPIQLPNVSSLAQSAIVTTSPSAITYTYTGSTTPAYTSSTLSYGSTNTSTSSIVNYLSSSTNINNYQSGNTGYIATPQGTTPISIVEDNTYTPQTKYTTKIQSNPFIGIEAPISDTWIFRLRAQHEPSNKRILDIRTFIYTPAVTTNNLNIMTDVTGQYASYETLTITQKNQSALIASFLYGFSPRFYTGMHLKRTKQNLNLSLNDNYNTNLTGTYKPVVNELGLETLFKFSQALSVSSSFQISKKKNYINRLLNFQINQINIPAGNYSYTSGTTTSTVGVDSTAYGISYIPLTSSEQGGWQACSGYTISGTSCSTQGSQSASVTDYYYNSSTPSSYGSSIPINNINHTLGPQLWYSRFHVRASVALEYDLHLSRN